MAKDKSQFIDWQRAREKKELKRKKKSKARSRALNPAYIRHINLVADHQRNQRFSSFQRGLFNSFYSQKLVSFRLEAPKILCFEKNNDETIEFIKSLFSTLDYCSKNNDQLVILSFAKCEELRYGPLMILNIIIVEFFKWKRKVIARGLPENLLPKLQLDEQMDAQISNQLATMHFPIHQVQASKTIPIFGIRPIEGVIGASTYKENSKGRIARKIRSHINESLRFHEVELNNDGEHLFDSMIGEILANADDHSEIDTWYTYANYSINESEDANTAILGELNLIFVNFGLTIYEGFFQARNLIPDSYNEMSQLYRNTFSTSRLRAAFPFSTMVTMYALQEGYSRLLHEDKSRGIGTMTFIKSFLDLGYSDDSFESILYILSGDALIKCTKEFPPFEQDGRYFLSLNDSNDLAHVPSNEHVKTLKGSFPGTMLFAKLYLHDQHLTERADA